MHRSATFGRGRRGKKAKRRLTALGGGGTTWVRGISSRRSIGVEKSGGYVVSEKLTSCKRGDGGEDGGAWVTSHPQTPPTKKNTTA